LPGLRACALCRNCFQRLMRTSPKRCSRSILRRSDSRVFGCSAGCRTVQCFRCACALHSNIGRLQTVTRIQICGRRRKSKHEFQEDVREIVVLVATNLYLEAVAASSRVDAARAQLRTYQAVFDRASNLKESGVAAGIDVLRAQVQLQAQRQRVVSTRMIWLKRS